jgi:hypothetical protein
MEAEMCFSIHRFHLRLMWIMLVLSLKIKTGPFLMRFSFIVGMNADGENCAYSPTLEFWKNIFLTSACCVTHGIISHHTHFVSLFL